jgi:hypothetical protein
MKKLEQKDSQMVRSYSQKLDIKKKMEPIRNDPSKSSIQKQIMG